MIETADKERDWKTRQFPYVISLWQSFICPCGVIYGLAASFDLVIHEDQSISGCPGVRFLFSITEKQAAGSVALGDVNHGSLSHVHRYTGRKVHRFIPARFVHAFVALVSRHATRAIRFSSTAANNRSVHVGSPRYRGWNIISGPRYRR